MNTKCYESSVSDNKSKVVMFCLQVLIAESAAHEPGPFCLILR